MHHHRSSVKANKPFKGTSNRKSKDAGKQALVIAPSSKKKVEMTKNDRRNRSKLMQKTKKQDSLASKRLFQGRFAVAKNIAIIPLCSDVNSVGIVQSLQNNDLIKSDGGYFECSRFKQKLMLLGSDRDVKSVIERCSVADVIVFVFSAVEEVDDRGELLMRVIKGLGVPMIVPVVQNLNLVEEKHHSVVLKSLLTYVNHHFAQNKSKVFNMNNETDCTFMLRSICESGVKSMRDERPYLVSDSVVYDQEQLQLHVTGYSRGLSFSANKLVYVPGIGNFQVEKIISAVQSDMEVVLDERDDGIAESLKAENDYDYAMNEQAIFTEEEIKQGEERTEALLAERRKKKRVPKGTSNYQAEWIIESEDEDENEIEMNDRMENEIEMNDKIEMNEIDRSDSESLTSDSEAIQEEEEFNRQEFEEYLSRRIKDEIEFPDEVDTPLNEAARVRFQKYRGLKSFRTSSWDPYENLPLDYSRIFQFENIKLSHKKALEEMNKSMNYVTIVLRNVSKEQFSLLDKFLVIYGLLKHEQKMTVQHCVLTNSSQIVIKSKDELILFSGSRQFKINPIFSQQSNSKLHKFERFFRPGQTSVASFYGPVHYTPCPALVFRRNIDGTLELIATGSMMDAQPDRLCIKRIILTGHPHKINKKSAVIRYMFFNPEDIRWFKPIQLSTKSGRRGHIKESVGTHGYMKCVFDKPIQSQDTVCLNLYKRVFPLWNEDIYSIIKSN